RVDGRRLRRRVAAIHYRLIYGLNIESAEAYMMPYTELLRIRRTLVLHHVLDPVVAIGRQVRNPVEAIVSRPALPEKAKPQHVFVELILIRRALHVYTDMQHMVGNAAIRDSLAAVFRLKRTFEILNELDAVSL